MFGDIKAINAWAKSEQIRKLAEATNGKTGAHQKKTCPACVVRRSAPPKEGGTPK